MPKAEAETKLEWGDGSGQRGSTTIATSIVQFAQVIQTVWQGRSKRETTTCPGMQNAGNVN